VCPNSHASAKEKERKQKEKENCKPRGKIKVA
jgi:hypothetical protein